MKPFYLSAAVAVGLLFTTAAVAEEVAVTAVKADVESAEVVEIKAEKPKLSNRNCVRETGSHIAKKDKNICNGLPGRSYDREDIERTGAMDIGQALERLDPSISIGRY